MAKYLKNVLIAIDQLANAILLGDPDETISSRMVNLAARNRQNAFGRLICWFLALLDPGHCRDAIEEDEGKDAIVE